MKKFHCHRGITGNNIEMNSAKTNVHFYKDKKHVLFTVDETIAHE